MESKFVSSSLVIGRRFLGVVLGIALGLTITLHFWGSAWWQVVIASAISGVIGAFIVETKAVWQVIIRAASWFGEEMRKTPEIIDSAGERLRKIPLKKFPRIPWKASVSLHTAGVWLNWAVLFLVLFLFLYPGQGSKSGLLILYILSFLGSFVFVRVLFFSLDNGMDERESFLWVPFPFAFLVKNFDSEPDWEGKEGTILGTLASCLGVWTFLWSVTMILVSFVALLLFFVLLWIGWGIFALIRLPLVITAFSRGSKILEVFASITIGVIAGTAFHSYWWGWGIGLGFLSLTFLPESVRERSSAVSKSYRQWIYDTWN